MPESNGSQGPSTVPDFNAVLRQAQTTGDFDAALNLAKNSHRMLIDFRDAISSAQFPGDESASVAMGLNFLENMISQAAGQLAAMKQLEKQTRDAMKKSGPDLNVLDPEKPADEPTAAPTQPEEAPETGPAPADTQEPA